MRTVLQAQQAKAPDAPSSDRSTDQADVDPWSTLSEKGQARAAALYGQCASLIGQLHDAQTAHVSTLRGTWINFLTHNVLRRIGNLDSDDKINGITNVLNDVTDSIVSTVTKFETEWHTVEHRAIDEHDWLVRQKFDDATLAATRVESLHNEAKGWLDSGALAFITDEDYADLKRTLDKRTHISTGVLQGSRIRAHEVHDLLDVVRELRLNDQDPEKYAPGWRKSVDNELENLEQLAKRTPSTPGTDFSAEFIRLRNELRAQRDAVLQKRPLGERVAERIASVPIAGAKATVGAVEALVGPFVEAAREIVDEVQIGLYYVSGGRLMPKFTSDLMKAFEQGATRTDVLKGLVTGLVGTPKRLLDAVEDGDWEAVGKEAVNLYLLTKVIKESPQAIRRVPEFLVATRRALRVLKARALQLRLKSPRLTPEPPTPRYGPTTPREPLPAEPTYLVAPTVAAIRDQILGLLRSGQLGGIAAEGVAFSFVRVVRTADGTLTVVYDIIENAGRIPDQGKRMQMALEEATRAAGRATGATTARVAVRHVQNPDWAEYLDARRYRFDSIEVEPRMFSAAYYRVWPL